MGRLGEDRVISGGLTATASRWGEEDDSLP